MTIEELVAKIKKAKDTVIGVVDSIDLKLTKKGDKEEKKDEKVQNNSK